MDDQNIPSDSVVEVETPAPAPEPAPTTVEPESSQPNGSTPTDLPSEAPESPISVPAPVPAESQNGAVNRPESEVTEPSNEISVTEPIQPVSDQSVSQSTSETSIQPQPASSSPTLQSQPSVQPVQQDQVGFIRALLAKANAKLHSNRQKKLDNLMLMAQKKRNITNDDVQKLLRVSDATATRYLVKLVEQGRLARVGNPRDAKYKFLR